MKMKKCILYLYAETPTHVGTGTGLGAVDMPIQREKHTGYPLIQASGVKGALRDTAQLELGDSDEMKSIFGSDADNTNITHASALSPSDARILLFPVRALNGVFVWVTSPTILERFKQETGLHNDPKVPDVPTVEKYTVLASHADRVFSGQIMLEEYTYAVADVEKNPLAKEWGKYLSVNALTPTTGTYWKSRLESHLVILHDDEFRNFARYSTDIVTRIHVDDVKKTVKDGALFTQELLPADSLLYSFLHVTDSRDEDRTKSIAAQKVLADLKNAIGERMQIGGDETVGRGRVRLNWQEV